LTGESIMTQEVGKTLIEKMPDGPDVSAPGGVEQTGGKDLELRDASGASFDSTLHQMSKDGMPKITKAGNFKKKPGKSKSAIANVTPPDEDASYKACGSSTAEIIFIAGQGIGGAEWKPRPEERAYMSDAWTQYYKAKGVEDLPPGVIVATALISYVAPRFTMPETQTRTKRFTNWFKGQLTRMKGVRSSNESHRLERTVTGQSEQDRMKID